jgi:phosphopantothenoylcysteine decarboxylase
MAKTLNILWGITGSVAAIRAPIIAHNLQSLGDIKVVVTQRGKHFLDPLPESIEILDDEHEWSSWSKLGDPVLHIELRKWADDFLIAPISADTLAKIANGFCDNLLLSVARAWDFQKPIVIAPAMNTFMWEHPTTNEHLNRLRSWGVQVIPPVEKELACKDIGIGALAPPDIITSHLAGLIGK